MARYTHTLLEALAAGFPDEDWCVLVPAGRPAPPIAGVRLMSSSLPSRALYGLSGLIGHPRLDRLLGGVDVFWAPAPAPMALSPDVPFVLTLHDLSWEQRRSDFTRYERLWHDIAHSRRLAARATRVLADSDATREQAIARWQLDPGRVATVPPAVRASNRDSTPDEIRSTLRRHGIPERYFLFVGALEPRKAPEVLADAFARACSAGLDADLVVAGVGRCASALAGERVHLLGRATDLDLDHLYRGALGLVLPSRLEGFGFPPLEAALRGVPSIVSDLPVFRETLGDAAIRVPVDDVAGLTRALIDLGADDSLRRRLGLRANEMATRFTPRASAAGVHAALAQAGRLP